nr:hypothetical protein [uncultured Ottowia sp.]
MTENSFACQSKPACNYESRAMKTARRHEPQMNARFRPHSDRAAEDALIVFSVSFEGVHP